MAVAGQRLPIQFWTRFITIWSLQKRVVLENLPLGTMQPWHRRAMPWVSFICHFCFMSHCFMFLCHPKAFCSCLWASHKSCSSCRAHPSLRWEARRFSSLQQVHAWFLSRSISDPWIQMHMLNGSSTAVQTLGDRLSKGDSSSHPPQALWRPKEHTEPPPTASSTWISVSACCPLEGCPANKKWKVTEDFRVSQKLLRDPKSLSCALCDMSWQENMYPKVSSPD